MRVNNSKKSGILWGQGLSKKQGIDGGNSPKNINIQGGDGGAIFGDLLTLLVVITLQNLQKKLQLRIANSDLLIIKLEISLFLI